MEAIALMADIHANLPAAEAVIADIRRKHKPDRIVSLGDQVNLGPAPCDTLRLLRAEGVTCLHGNHEGYILSVMRGEPGYAGRISRRSASTPTASPRRKSPLKRS